MSAITSLWLLLYIIKSTQKKSRVLRHYFLVATIFCIYKGISQKYKGKYATGPLLLSFEAGWSN
jgi:hypothetical protein